MQLYLICFAFLYGKTHIFFLVVGPPEPLCKKHPELLNRKHYFSSEEKIEKICGRTTKGVGKVNPPD